MKRKGARGTRFQVDKGGKCRSAQHDHRLVSLFSQDSWLNKIDEILLVVNINVNFAGRILAIVHSKTRRRRETSEIWTQNLLFHQLVFCL